MRRWKSREKPEEKEITVAGLSLPLLMFVLMPLVTVPLAFWFYVQDEMYRSSQLAVGGGGVAMTVFLYVLCRLG